MTQVISQRYFWGIPIGPANILRTGQVFHINKRSTLPVFWSEGKATLNVGKQHIISVEGLSNGIRISFQRLEFAGIESAAIEKGRWENREKVISVEELKADPLRIRNGLSNIVFKIS